MISRTQFNFSGIQLDEAKIRLLSSPLSAEIQRGWNQPSTLALVYSKRVLSQVFDNLVFPLEVRVAGDLLEDGASESKKIQIFRGFLKSFSISRGEESVILQYIDPLVTAEERDETYIFKDQTLEQIAKTLFSNSFAQIKGGHRISINFDAPALQIDSATNMDGTDLQFLQKLCREYGYYFCYDHTDSQKEMVQFTRPDFSKKGNIKVHLSEISKRYYFSSSILNFLSEVVVTGRSGIVKVSAKDYSDKVGPSFRKKLEARDQNGIELVSQFQFPNLSASESRAYAEARQLEALLSGDSLSFTSEQYIPFGAYMDLVCDSADVDPSHQRLQGTYWIMEIKSLFQDAYWLHQYEGRKP